MLNSNYVISQISKKWKNNIIKSKIYNRDKYLNKDQEIYIIMN